MPTASEMSECEEAEQRRQMHAEFYAQFVKRYRPTGHGSYDFDRDLQHLLYISHEEAVRPFVYELKRYRDAHLMPVSPIVTSPRSEKSP
jgi:hypothetical protein